MSGHSLKQDLILTGEAIGFSLLAVVVALLFAAGVAIWFSRRGGI